MLIPPPFRADWRDVRQIDNDTLEQFKLDSSKSFQVNLLRALGIDPAGLPPDLTLTKLKTDDGLLGLIETGVTNCRAVDQGQPILPTRSHPLSSLLTPPVSPFGLSKTIFPSSYLLLPVCLSSYT